MEELKVKISVKVLSSDYTCDGQNISPEIDIGGVNLKIAKSIAIIVIDPDAPGGGGFVHWIAWNMELVSMIPEKIPKTPVVTLPIRAVQGKKILERSGITARVHHVGRLTGFSLNSMHWIQIFRWLRDLLRNKS